MTTEDNIKITYELAKQIVNLLDEKLADNKRRAYPMPDIFRDLEKEIKEIYPETDKYKFQKALSAATKKGQLKGYEVKLGKNGGLGKVDYKKPGSPEVTTQVVTVPVKESSSLEFGGKSYRLELSQEKLEKLLTKVFRLPEAPDGDIIFDERHFMTEGAEVRTYIDNLLFYFTETDNDDYQGADND